MTASTDSAWPELTFGAWRETYDTLHMWTQIVGKICLALTPLSNHYWNIAFHMTARGLATPAMIFRGRTLTILFDFVGHELVLQCSDGGIERIRLEPRSVAEFYDAVMAALQRLGVDVRIWTMPVEVPNPVRFERDTEHKSYDPAWTNAFWRAMTLMKPVFENFRCEFVGKCSPVHFFWGSFDLAVTRFSGKRAPARPGADAMTREAYSHEVISHGFWPGSGDVPAPSFYAYAVPEPAGFRSAAILPSAAAWSTTFNDFLLPYEAVRSAASPESELAAFLESTYDRAATLAGWPRADLERGRAEGAP